jgi:hypothetical protein
MVVIRFEDGEFDFDADVFETRSGEPFLDVLQMHDEG